MSLFSRALDFIRDVFSGGAEPPHEPPVVHPPPAGDKGPNSRGYDFDQIRLDYGKWIDSNSRVHKDPPSSTSQLRRADMVTVKFTYPDGEEVWRTFGNGPFDDWEDLLDDVEDWFYDTEY